jgi:2-polyprenyl-3-methyl-5-hydroxy-6-metoxy-1,4-benzoquinol methylase
VRLSVPEGNIELTPVGGGRTRIDLKPFDPKLYIPVFSCETSHESEVEFFVHSGVSFAWLCDAISRFEDPEGVRRILERQLFAYLEPESLRGMRVLDLGCGRGASSFAIAELLPSATVVGLELDAELVRFARQLVACRGVSNLTFFVSPAGDHLPPDLGKFDVIMLSAVYEHLLPEERRRLMPRIWAALRPGGTLFVNQTPHRWVPFEHHSTGLWGINYLPDRIAHQYARRFARISPAINRSPDWQTHLRGGLRGGTERTIVSDLTLGSDTRGVILQPNRARYRDRADYWLGGTSQRLRPVKRCIAFVFRISDRLFDSIPALNVDVAIRKELLT